MQRAAAIERAPICAPGCSPGRWRLINIIVNARALLRRQPDDDCPVSTQTFINIVTTTHRRDAGECGKNNRSNPCEQICLDLHDGTYECSCFYGFTLAVDGYSCAQLLITHGDAPEPPARTDNKPQPLITAPMPKIGPQLQAPDLGAGPAGSHQNAGGSSEFAATEQPDGGQLLAGDNANPEISAADDNRKLAFHQTARGAELNSNEIGADDRHATGSGRLDSAASRKSAKQVAAGRSGRQRRLLGAAESKSRWFLDKMPTVAASKRPAQRGEPDDAGTSASKPPIEQQQQQEAFQATTPTPSSGSSNDKGKRELLGLGCAHNGLGCQSQLSEPIRESRELCK